MQDLLYLLIVMNATEIYDNNILSTEHYLTTIGPNNMLVEFFVLTFTGTSTYIILRVKRLCMVF